MESFYSAALAISVSPKQALFAFRSVAKKKGWKIHVTEGTKIVSRFVIIAPLTSAVTTIEASIYDPGPNIRMKVWSASPTSGGILHHIEWAGLDDNAIAQLQKFVVEWTTYCPRAPWKWTFGERSRVGYLLPEYRKTKKWFKKIGINTNSWKEWPINKINEKIDEIKQSNDE